MEEGRKLHRKINNNKIQCRRESKSFDPMSLVTTSWYEYPVARPKHDIVSKPLWQHVYRSISVINAKIELHVHIHDTMNKSEIRI